MNFKKIIIFIVLLLSVSLTFADSFYASMGLGLPNYYVSSGATAMGGNGIGVRDFQSLNIMNPAALDIKKRTTISVYSYLEQVNSKYQDENILTRNGNPAGFHFFVPVLKKFTMIAGLHTITRAKYNLSIKQSTPYVDYTRMVIGSGGLSAGTLGLQYAVNPSLSFGIKANFNFGTFNEDWKTQFADGTYADATDQVSSHMWGSNIELGLWVMPMDLFSLGIVYQSAGKLNVEENILLGSGIRTITEESDLTQPQGLGVGTCFNFTKVKLAVDFYTRFWDQYKVNGKEANKFDNYTRYGAGLEYQDSQKAIDAYTRRIAYRIGTYYAQLPYRGVANNNVNELFFTTGISFPFHGNYGRIDLALEYGQRTGGDLGYDENIVRFSAAFSGSELWFLRRH